MADLNKLVNDSLAELENEGYIKQVVRDTLKKSISSIIGDIFSSYGKFGGELKEYIKKNLKVNLPALNLEGYNKLVLEAIKEQLDKDITAKGVNKMKEVVEKLLSDVKEQYNLSELIEALKDEADGEFYDYDDKIALVINVDDDKYTHIYMDLNGNHDKDSNNLYSYEYQISMNNENKVYSIRFGDQEINTKKVMGGLFGLEALLFKIYASDSKIILDKGEDPYNYDIHFTTNEED